MKTISLILGLNFLAPLAIAEPLTVAWSTVSGGGGTSAAGQFAVAGHVSSAAPGTSTDGVRFTLDSGFWVAIDLGEPINLLKLRIEHSGSSAVLIWSLSAENVVLEESPNLLPSTWSPVNLEPETIGAERRLTVPLQSDRRFFRLRKF